MHFLCLTKKFTYKLLPRVIDILYIYMNLTAIGTVRYLGTFRPFLYATWTTPKMMTVSSVFIVVYSIIIPSWLVLGHHRPYPRQMCAFFITCPPWATTIMSGHTYVLMAAVAFVYQRILREALRVKRQISATVPEALEDKQNGQNQPDSDEIRLQENLNVIKNFAIIVGTSFMVWLPHAILSQYLSYQPLRNTLQPKMAMFILAMAIAMALIPVLNPIIYATRLKWFKALLRYVKGSVTYRECEQSMSDIWSGILCCGHHPHGVFTVYSGYRTFSAVKNFESDLFQAGSWQHVHRDDGVTFVCLYASISP